MIIRPSPSAADVLRLEALYRLVSYLESRGPADVSWAFGIAPPYNLMGLRISVGETAAQLVVHPMWFLGPHRNDFTPFPTGEQCVYALHRLHWRDEPTGPPYAFEHMTTAGPDEILAAVLRWKAEGPRAEPTSVSPIGDDEVSWLRTLATTAAEPPEIVHEIDDTALTPDSRARLDDDLSHVSREALALHIPRDERGRPALGAYALLASYESEEELGAKQVWLAVLTPGRRRDPQVIRLAVCTLARGPYPHVWEDTRWLWDDRAAGASERERWGVEGLDVSLLGSGDRTARIRDLSGRCAAGGSLADRVALCILLQDEGRLEEAFALFGIRLADSLLRLIHGLPIAGYLSNKLPSWITFAREQLRSAAPWLMPPVLTAEAERRMALRSRPKRPPYFRLCALPHQPTASKMSLMLVAGSRDGTEPALDLEGTGWDYRLPETLWKRPLEIDLRRFGLVHDE